MFSVGFAGWRGVASYALRGAAAGAVVGLATALLAAPAYGCTRPGLGCIPVTFGVIAATLLVGVLLGWVLLLVLRVRWPLLLAAGGMTTTLLLVVTIAAAGVGEAPRFLLPMAGVAAAGYAAAAAVFCEHATVPVRAVAGAVLGLGVVLLMSLL